MATDKSKPYLSVWLKFKPEYRQNEAGTAVYHDNFHSPRELNYLKRRYWKNILKHKNAGKLLKARVYQHPGNTCIWSWHLPFETQSHGKDQN